MPRTAIKYNNRLSLRIRASDKATIMRGSVLAQTDMTDFIVRNAVRAAQAVIDRSEHIILSERDGMRVLELLENSPPPNAKLLAAARVLPPRKLSFFRLRCGADRCCCLGNHGAPMLHALGKL